MPTSIRLDPETEALIRRLTEVTGSSTSSIIREAVAAYAADEPRLQHPYDVLSPFIGAGETAATDRSEQTGKRFAELLKRRSRARRPR